MEALSRQVILLLLLCATTVSGAEDPSIAGGSIDPSHKPDLSGLQHFYRASALQADQRLLIAGRFDTADGGSQWLRRLLPDGSFDSFPAGVGPDDSVHHLAIGSAGEIYIGGGFETVNGEDHPHLARLDDKGLLDTGFRPFEGWPLARISGLLLLKDGSILVSGTMRRAHDERILNLVRFTQAGVFDPGFSTPLEPVTVDCMAQQLDGKILLAITYLRGDGTKLAGGLFRLNANGTIDDTFQSPFAEAHIGDMVVESDNSILVGGILTMATDGSVASIARLSENGGMDLNFSPLIASRHGLWVERIARLPDETILVAGGFTTVNGIPQPGIARLAANGAHDISFFSDLSELIPPETERWETFVLGLHVTDSGQPIFILQANLLNSGSTWTGPAYFARKLKLVEPASPPTIGIGAVHSALSEDQGPFEMRIYRHGDASEIAVASYVTENGTAIAGDDFVARSETVQFAPGERLKTFQIPVLDDDVVTQHRTFGVRIHAVTGAAAEGENPLELTIIENDLFIGFVHDTYRVYEPGGPINVRLHAYGSPYGRPRRIRIYSEDDTARAGIDYAAVDRVISIIPSDFTIPIELIDNPDADGPRTAKLKLELLDELPFKVDLIAVQDDGGILMVTESPSSPAAKLFRLTPEGSIDTAFHSATFTKPDEIAPPFTTEPSDSPVITSLSVLPNGGFFVSGEFTAIDGAPYFRFATIDSIGYPADAVRFQSVHHSNGSLHLEVHAPADSRSVLEVSMDLKDWRLLETEVRDGATIDVTSSVETGSRFFRARKISQ